MKCSLSNCLEFNSAEGRQQHWYDILKSFLSRKLYPFQWGIQPRGLSDCFRNWFPDSGRIFEARLVISLSLDLLPFVCMYFL